jgi:hypothetical protein
MMRVVPMVTVMHVAPVVMFAHVMAARREVARAAHMRRPLEVAGGVAGRAGVTRHGTALLHHMAGRAFRRSRTGQHTRQRENGGGNQRQELWHRTSPHLLERSNRGSISPVSDAAAQALLQSNWFHPGRLLPCEREDQRRGLRKNEEGDFVVGLKSPLLCPLEAAFAPSARKYGPEVQSRRKQSSSRRLRKLICAEASREVRLAFQARVRRTESAANSESDGARLFLECV